MIRFFIFNLVFMIAISQPVQSGSVKKIEIDYAYDKERCNKHREVLLDEYTKDVSLLAGQDESVLIFGKTDGLSWVFDDRIRFGESTELKYIRLDVDNDGDKDFLISDSRMNGNIFYWADDLDIHEVYDFVDLVNLKYPFLGKAEIGGGGGFWLCQFYSKECDQGSKDWYNCVTTCPVIPGSVVYLGLIMNEDGSSSAFFYDGYHHFFSRIRGGHQDIQPSSTISSHSHPAGPESESSVVIA